MVRESPKLALLCLALATVAWSQAPPASVYSIGGMHMPPPRASVYSAPSFSQPCCGASVFFGGSFGHNPRFNVGVGGPRFAQRFNFERHHRRFGNGGFGVGAVPVYVPYYASGYGYDYPIEGVDPNYEMTGPGTYERPSDTARRYYESEALRAEEDDRYGEHYLDTREAARRSTPSGSPATSMPNTGVTTANGNDDGTPTLLVYRDGHQSEIGNYAIMGSTIFVLSGQRTRIPLSEIDVPKTQAANYERGIDFRVPPAK